jgi:hypothetical protein
MDRNRIESPVPIGARQRIDVSRPRLRTLLASVLVGVTLALGLLHGTAAAQQRLVVTGTVQWTASGRVQVMSDPGVSVSIDVSRIDQSAVAALRGGDRVRVVGYPSPDRSRLIAESIEPGETPGGFWGLFPQTG